MHAKLCMHILASIFQDGSNPFPLARLPVLNSVTDLSQHSATTPVTVVIVTSGIYNTKKRHWLPCGTGAHMYACA